MGRGIAETGGGETARLCRANFAHGPIRLIVNILGRPETTWLKCTDRDLYPSSIC